MPDSESLPVAPPSSLGVVGNRTQVTAIVLGLWNLIRVFGWVDVTEVQSLAVNGVLLSIVAYFGADKIKRLVNLLMRLQGTASATAATAISLAKDVGVEHVEDPAVTPAPTTPVPPLALLALLLLPLLGCATQPIATRWSYCRDAAHQGWCSRSCGRQQPAWCGEWTPISPPDALFCWYQLRDGSVAFRACPVAAGKVGG